MLDEVEGELDGVPEGVVEGDDVDGVGVGEPHAVVNRRMARSTAPIRRRSS